MGGTAPDPTLDRTLPNGCIVPLGHGKKTGVANSSLLYNEYPFHYFCHIMMKSLHEVFCMKSV